MSGPESIDTPEWWLSIAREDLMTAERLTHDSDIPPRQSCFFAQHAAEKAIKAALISEAIEFPYTHDLERLLSVLPTRWPIHEQAREVAGLTQWAVTFRYPGDWTPPTEEDARLAVAQARGVVQSIERDLAALGDQA